MTSLVKKIDAATEKNSGCNMASFAVFLGDDEGLEKKLKKLAEKEKLKNTTLTIVEKKDGPPGYPINKNADITVLLYVNKTVKANFAFAKGKITDKDIEKIIGDLKKILPKDDK